MTQERKDTTKNGKYNLSLSRSLSLSLYVYIYIYIHTHTHLKTHLHTDILIQIYEPRTLCYVNPQQSLLGGDSQILPWPMGSALAFYCVFHGGELLPD